MKSFSKTLKLVSYVEAYLEPSPAITMGHFFHKTVDGFEPSEAAIGAVL